MVPVYPSAYKVRMVMGIPVPGTNNIPICVDEEDMVDCDGDGDTDVVLIVRVMIEPTRR